MSIELGNTLLVIGICLIVAIFGFMVSDMPASRKRVEKLARRHQLEITENNGTQILVYLRTIRRWRAACIIFALSLNAAIEFQRQRFEINFAVILAGVLAGILLAEIRMVTITSGRRSASLVKRRLREYLHFPGRMALIGGVTVAIGLSLLVLANDGAESVGWLVIARAPVIGVISWLTIRRILQRAQPLAGADQLTADNAIRRQSLQSLAASGSALTAYAVLAQLGFFGSEILAIPMIVIGLIGVPWFAWYVATRRTEPRDDRRDRPVASDAAV